MRSRFTIDLSNDPDIQKYFAANDETDKTKGESPEIKLIDISESVETAPAQTPSLNKDLQSLSNGLDSLMSDSLSTQSSQPNNSNNLELLLNIDFSTTEPANSPKPPTISSIQPMEPAKKPLPASNTFALDRNAIVNRHMNVPNSA